MQFPAATCVLFAAGFDWLEAVLPFLFVAFWILSQVFAVFRRLQGGGQKPPALPRFDPARDRQRLPRPPADDAAVPRTDLEKQIAEFLREATGEQQRQPTIKKAPPSPAKKPQPARPIQRTDAERRVSQEARGQGSRDQGRRDGTSERRKQEPKQPAVAVVKTAAIAPESSETNVSVSRHVQDAFARELTHLQGAIKQDEAKTSDVVSTAATQAEELRHLLRSPATIRQVILLREVLDRPVDRW
jgi:hypothetical protein